MPSSPTRRSVARGRRPVTMSDLAREAGVSQSTVSRVLNEAPFSIQISEDTRDRVLAAASRLGYRPNPLARGLRGAPTMLLGVIVRDITDPFFAGAIEAVTMAASGQGYNVVLAHAHGHADEAIALRSVLETRHVDAILLLGDMTDQPRLIRDLQGDHVPVVALWQGNAVHDLPSVSVDNASGIAQVLDHLKELGHRRIAFIGGRPLGDIRERQAAYEERAASGDIDARTDYVQHVSNDPAGGNLALTNLLGLAEPPTAIVCSTDQLAIGVLHGASNRELRVPGALSVTGFDDLQVSEFTVPALTTVRMPVAEMASRAVQIAVGGVAEDSRGTPVILKPELIVRGSTGPPIAP
jgi:DNA-binding LacI/PurR family transcriptional regulator